MKPVISFNGVTKIYGNTPALKDLNFSLAGGENVALVGNNGCGKTTTVNVLVNLVSYDKGDVFVFDKRVTPTYVSYKNRFGVLLSPPILIKEFTVVEYLKFVCKFQKVEPSIVSERIEDLLCSFEIESSKRKKISDYSAGGKMKIALAASMVHNPEVLVFDEPFIHLDIKTTEFLMNLLNSIKGKKSLFITSPNLDLILSICERVLIMEDGKIINDFLKEENSSIQTTKERIKELVLCKNGLQKMPSWFNADTL